MPPQTPAHADLTEEDKLTFLVVELHLARCPPLRPKPPPPQTQAQQMTLQASFAGPWHAAKTSDSVAGAVTTLCNAAGEAVNSDKETRTSTADALSSARAGTLT
jgi:hypothetical protein